MNHPEPTSQFASMEAILASVAQPVWVVDHDGFVVYVNPAGLAALGYDELSELRGRFGHDAIHYKHRDGIAVSGRGLPDDEGPRDGESVQMDEDWFVRRDGSMFPVSYTSTPLDMPDGPGVVVAFKDIEEQREAEQALREREAILAHGRPAGVGRPMHTGRFHYANPAALAALGFSEVSELVGQPAHDTRPLQVPGRVAVPRGGLPARPGAQGGGDAAGHRGLARAQGRLDRARHLLVGALRTARRAGLGDRLHGCRGAALVPSRRRASATSPQARAEELRVARRRIIEAADAARAQLERDLHDGAQQQFVSAMLQLQLAERRAASDPDGARELRAQAIELAGAGVDELRRLAAGIHPAILTDRGLGPAVESLASRLPLPVTVARTPDVRLPGAVEASVYFFVSEALTNVVKHARRTRDRQHRGLER